MENKHGDCIGPGNVVRLRPEVQKADRPFSARVVGWMGTDAPGSVTLDRPLQREIIWHIDNLQLVPGRSKL